jgi:hypothetical protein
MKFSRILVACVFLFGLSQSLWSQTTTVGGKIVVNFKIKLDSPLGTGTILGCEVNASVFDPNNSISERAFGIATVSGSTAKCAVSIPYSWPLTSANLATDKLTLGYLVEALETFEIPGSGTSSTQAAPVRQSSQNIGTFSIPANGATTTENVSVTL